MMSGMEQFTETFMRNAENMTRQADMFTRMWTDLASKMAVAGFSLNPETTPPDMARQMRSTFLKALGEYTEEFMRSPQFLEMMRQTMNQSLDLRQQIDSFLTQTYHQFQGVAREDVDSLMLTMRHMETRVLDRMESLNERLDQISQRLDALDQERNGHTTPTTKRTPTAASSRSKTAPAGAGNHIKGEENNNE